MRDQYYIYGHHSVLFIYIFITLSNDSIMIVRSTLTRIQVQATEKKKNMTAAYKTITSFMNEIIIMFLYMVDKTFRVKK